MNETPATTADTTPETGPDTTPDVERIRKVLVIGSGAMGSQIGLVVARAGYEVTLTDIAQDALDRARDQLAARLDRDVEKGRTAREDADAALVRMEFSTDLAGAAADADLVVEAAVEKLGVKRSIFAQLDAVCPPRTILATNSSTIGSSRIADATNRPDRVCNLHFFNPALVMKCVEVVRHPQTSEATVEAVAEFARRIGKQPVLLHREIPGFVANRLMGALRNEALKLQAEGIASVEDIDTAARTALGHPMGPFELMDLVGLDVTYLIRMAEYEETGDPSALPHPAVTELYEAGRLGRKTGHGWYRYDS